MAAAEGLVFITKCPLFSLLNKRKEIKSVETRKKLEYIDDFITINEYSRPGYYLNDIKAVCVHWVENPGTSAKFNRDWFAINCPQLKKYASTQYIVGLEGEIIRMMPENERANAVGAAGKVDPVSGQFYTDLARSMFGQQFCANPFTPSYVTISIEMCHTDKAGSFTEKTLESCANLIADIFERNPSKLKDPMTQIIRHYDVVGWKSCPKWFVDHEDDFIKFKERVSNLLKGGSV